MTTDADALKCAIREVMDEREQGIPAAEHAEHHKLFSECIPWMREEMRIRKGRREAWERWRSSFVGAIAVAIVGVVVGFLGWVGHLILAWLHSGASSK